MAGGPERWVLAIALAVPLGIVGLSVAQLPEPFNPTRALAGDAPSATLVHRPAASELAPPPTLAPPTPTPVPPTPTPLPPTPGPTPTPQGQTTYVVRAGDQLKYIAADHGVSIQSILAANDVSNPDSLRVGQTLTIPPPRP
jgi:nucleoid-associated protein YgaU